MRSGCRSVAFTYNDPVIFLEYAVDVAQACRERGIKTVAVSAGYISPEPRIEFFRYMDAANIDLKLLENFSRLACHCDALLFLFYRSPVTPLPERRRNTLLSVSPSQLGDRPAITHC